MWRLLALIASVALTLALAPLKRYLRQACHARDKVNRRRHVLGAAAMVSQDAPLPLVGWLARKRAAGATLFVLTPGGKKSDGRLPDIIERFFALHRELTAVVTPPGKRATTLLPEVRRVGAATGCRRFNVRSSVSD